MRTGCSNVYVVENMLDPIAFFTIVRQAGQRHEPLAVGKPLSFLEGEPTPILCENPRTFSRHRPGTPWGSRGSGGIFGRGKRAWTCADHGDKSVFQVEKRKGERQAPRAAKLKTRNAEVRVNRWTPPSLVSRIFEKFASDV
jgi:hypothetical protein